ncbi:MAG: hypothetical protein SF053_19130 [Bacteroidia bacterium]|nr:hypothetical protein [Bacteroidia bacterium]
MKSSKKGVWALLACWMLYLPVTGQGVTAVLRFETDTVSIGRPVRLRLTVEHPQDAELLLQESRDAFWPFELMNTMREPSRNNLPMALTLISYRLRTFEVMPRQAVRIRMAAVIYGDTIPIEVVSDSIRLNSRIQHVTPELSYRPHQTLAPLADPPDYTRLGIMGAGLLITLIILGVSLRKPLIRYFRLRQIRREWLNTVRRVQNMEQERDPVLYVSAMNALWKGLLDPEDQYGLKSMTTTELSRYMDEIPGITDLQRDALLHASRTGDRVVHAGLPLTNDDAVSIAWEVRRLIDTIFNARILSVKS